MFMTEGMDIAGAAVFRRDIMQWQGKQPLP